MKHTTTQEKLLLGLAVAHLAVILAWILLSPNGVFIYTRVYIEQEGRLVAACFNTATAPSPAATTGTAVGDTLHPTSNTWEIKHGNYTLTTCSAIHVEGIEESIRSAHSSTYHIRGATLIAIHHAHARDLSVYWSIEILDQKDLAINTTASILSTTTALYLIIQHNKKDKDNRLGAKLAGLSLYTLLLGAALAMIAVTAGDVPLYFLAQASTISLAALLTTTALLLEDATLPATVTVLLTTPYIYYIVSTGPSIVHALEGVLALTRTGHAEAILVAPAYYPLTATLALLALALATAIKPDRVQALLTPEPAEACLLLAATLILQSVWPTTALTTARVLATVVITGLCVKNLTQRQGA